LSSPSKNVECVVVLVVLVDEVTTVPVPVLVDFSLPPEDDTPAEPLDVFVTAVAVTVTAVPGALECVAVFVAVVVAADDQYGSVWLVAGTAVLIVADPLVLFVECCSTPAVRLTVIVVQLVTPLNVVTTACEPKRNDITIDTLVHKYFVVHR
jgi:predicted cobalt transporter CbtA